MKLLIKLQKLQKNHKLLQKQLKGKSFNHGILKIINLFDNTPNEPSKFRTKSCVEIFDDSSRISNPNRKIKYKTSMLKSSLCIYNDVNILFKGTLTVSNMAAAAAAANNDHKKEIFKHLSPFY